MLICLLRATYVSFTSVAASQFKNNFETKDVGGLTDINLQSEAEDNLRHNDVIESDKEEI